MYSLSCQRLVHILIHLVMIIIHDSTTPDRTAATAVVSSPAASATATTTSVAAVLDGVELVKVEGVVGLGGAFDPGFVGDLHNLNEAMKLRRECTKKLTEIYRVVSP